MRRAAMDAEMDIRKKKMDAKKRKDELQEVTINRRQLTQTRRRNELNRNSGYLEQESDKSITKNKSENRAALNSDNKISRTVRTIRKDEIIKTRKAAMDRDSETIKSKVTMANDRNESIKRQIVQLHRQDIQDDSDSNTLEDDLPDLRQRLVDRKHKRDLDKPDPNCNSASKYKGHQKSALLSKKRHADMTTLDSEEDEHYIPGELMYDRNGRNVLPKNLRIQATIRNERHDKDSSRSGVEHQRNIDESSKDPLKTRKRRSNIDENDKTRPMHSTKKRRTDVAKISDEEDELLEMRRNAIESMRRRKEGSNVEIGEIRETSLKKKHQLLHENKDSKHRQKVHNSEKSKDSRKKRQNETIKREILEIQEGDSDDAMSSISSVAEPTDVSEVSENTADGDSNKKVNTTKNYHNEDSEISLSSTEDEDEIKTSIPIHTTNKNVSKSNAVIHEGKTESDKKNPQFIVTLDGINSAYFKKEDKEVSKGGLKLKKHEPTSQTVYITSNRAPVLSNPQVSVSQSEKPVISLPNNKIHDESSQNLRNSMNDGSLIVEKPKARVAPLRKTISPVINITNKNSSLYQLPRNSPTNVSNTTLPISIQEKAPNVTNQIQNDSKEIPKRKRILPPEISPTESPHSVLAGTNRYVSRTISQTSSHSPGIM